jgi:uroporphyrinogen-III synthase
MRVLITRPRAQAEHWVQALRRGGLEAHALPLIDIAPVADRLALEVAWQGLSAYSALMFVSANAVEAFMAARPPSLDRLPPGLLACSTGSGTTRALLAAAWPPENCVQPASDASVDSEGLWAQLSLRDWVGRRVLIVRGQEGRSWLMQQWQQAGATVDVVVAYERKLPIWSDDESHWARQALVDPGRTLWSLTSSEAVRHLGQLMPGPASQWSASHAVVTHPRIAASARDLGFGDVQTVPPDLSALIQHARQVSLATGVAP